MLRVSKQLPLLGTEIAKMAQSAIESTRNLFQTFFKQGLGVPKYGRLLALVSNLASQRLDGISSGKTYQREAIYVTAMNERV